MEKTMNLHDFYYDLPQELIAQDPLEDRSSSRLMVLNKNTGKIQHHIFKDIVNYTNENIVCTDTISKYFKLVENQNLGDNVTIKGKLP